MSNSKEAEEHAGCMLKNFYWIVILFVQGLRLSSRLSFRRPASLDPLTTVDQGVKLMLRLPARQELLVHMSQPHDHNPRAPKSGIRTALAPRPVSQAAWFHRSELQRTET